jgi:thiopeptide-type bacteriocin biosynthesis protein
VQEPETPWCQVNLAYPGSDRPRRERYAVAHLSRVLPAAEAAGLITSWWFIRKGPWRIRYLPTQTPAGPDPVHRLLTETVPGTTDIYEPEIHAFGGGEAMAAAHLLFHDDSRHLLRFLHRDPADRRERSLILCTALMRTAGLDLYEQGDVWARVAQLRAIHLNRTPVPDRRSWDTFTGNVRYLVVGAVRTPDDWHAAFQHTGTALRGLRESGRLTRGLRAVITQHVIFHWNRIGLAATTQALLAQAAKEAILGS